MEPDSNQQSSTSVTRRMVDLPDGSSGLGRVISSMAGRCRSVISTPKSACSSASEPYTSVRGNSGLSDFHTGIGLPQYRLRLIDQSRVFSSHLPNWPCLTCSGTQVIRSLSFSISSLIAVVETNQDVTA